jgi:hypothetical protein
MKMTEAIFPSAETGRVVELPLERLESFDRTELTSAPGPD